MSTDSSKSFLWAMLGALTYGQSTMEWMQIADENMTSLNAQLEDDYYGFWDDQLTNDANSISAIVNGGASQDDKQNQIAEAQAKYQTDSTTAQTAQNMCDAATQAAQQTAGEDGTNLQNMLSLSTVLSSVQSSLASMISRAYT
ncbi:MAG: hypothetical protein EBZ47_03205 [Chlamydiae bacterium]|nr:hypothetical protein [Chlamydiota bacterium]